MRIGDLPQRQALLPSLVNQIPDRALTGAQLFPPLTRTACQKQDTHGCPVVECHSPQRVEQPDACIGIIHGQLHAA
ncbi:MAG TPA: hypothetical protein DHU96_18265 [Actinobacteria bacterium]|nr:hypothetical protein [Actinomycetota bacterium]